MDLESYRQTARKNWERVAPSWGRERERIWEVTGPIGLGMVGRLAPQPGETVLELAAGTGDTGFAAASRLGAKGRLITTDLSEGMLAQARRVGAALGLDNVEYRLLDAESMDLPDDCVDGVLCRFGYMLMAEPLAALSETRRVLRAGGRLSFAVWGPPERNLWASVTGPVLVERGHMPPPEPGAPGMFALADPDRLRRLVESAGFGEPRIEPIPIRWRYRNADEHWRLTLELSGPLADLIGELDEDEVAAVRAAVRARIEPVIAGGGVEGIAHLVTAS